MLYSKFEQMLRKRRISKKLRKKLMKNEPRRGKSVRNGNAPSPYTKYNKTPYRYTTVASNTNTSRSGPTKNVEQEIKRRKYAA